MAVKPRFGSEKLRYRKVPNSRFPEIFLKPGEEIGIDRTLYSNSNFFWMGIMPVDRLSLVDVFSYIKN